MEKFKNILFFGGIGKEEYLQTKKQVAYSNHRALLHWSVLVSAFWLYCLVMSLRAEDYAMCRPAYTTALSMSIVSYLCARILVPKFPKMLFVLMCFFRLSLLGGAIGIAVCQWNVRSLTLFAVAIISPSIFIDSTVSSVAVHSIALVGYILLGKGTIAPDIYTWGLGNYILFSVFGFFIGNAINKERFERYVFADSAKKLAEMQTKYAYYDQMTGLKNRRSYAERLQRLQEDMPRTCCVVMVDINGLKKKNDTCGHNAGDELIIGTAQCLRTAFPGAEDIYRLGGDEFCVIVTNSEEKVKSCLSVLEQIAAEWKGEYSQTLSLAFGMASARDPADIETVVKEADARMYEAKRTHYSVTEHDGKRR